MAYTDRHLPNILPQLCPDRYLAAKRGSAFVKLSLQGIREWRARHAELYPATPHVWTTAAPNSSVPVVCCICMNPVAGSQWQVGLQHRKQSPMEAVRSYHPLHVPCTPMPLSPASTVALLSTSRPDAVDSLRMTAGRWQCGQTDRLITTGNQLGCCCHSYRFGDVLIFCNKK